MEREYLVIWLDWNGRHADVVKLEVPPHDAPRARDLDRLAAQAVRGREMDIFAVLELPQACWSPGASRDLSLADGRVTTLECRSGEGWRVNGG